MSLLGEWKIEPLPKSETGGYRSCLLIPSGELFVADQQSVLVRSPWAAVGWEKVWEADPGESAEGIRLDPREVPEGLLLETNKRAIGITWERPRSDINQWASLRYRFRSRVLRGVPGAGEARPAPLESPNPLGTVAVQASDRNRGLRFLGTSGGLYVQSEVAERDRPNALPSPRLVKGIGAKPVLGLGLSAGRLVVAVREGTEASPDFAVLREQRIRDAWENFEVTEGGRFESVRHPNGPASLSQFVQVRDDLFLATDASRRELWEWSAGGWLRVVQLTNDAFALNPDRIELEQLNRLDSGLVVLHLHFQNALLVCRPPNKLRERQQSNYIVSREPYIGEVLPDPSGYGVWAIRRPAEGLSTGCAFLRPSGIDGVYKFQADSSYQVEQWRLRDATGGYVLPETHGGLLIPIGATPHFVRAGEAVPSPIAGKGYHIRSLLPGVKCVNAPWVGIRARQEHGAELVTLDIEPFGESGLQTTCSVVPNTQVEHSDKLVPDSDGFVWLARNTGAGWQIRKLLRGGGLGLQMDVGKLEDEPRYILDLTGESPWGSASGPGLVRGDLWVFSNVERKQLRAGAAAPPLRFVPMKPPTKTVADLRTAPKTSFRDLIRTGPQGLLESLVVSTTFSNEDNLSAKWPAHAYRWGLWSLDREPEPFLSPAKEACLVAFFDKSNVSVWNTKPPLDVIQGAVLRDEPLDFTTSVRVICPPLTGPEGWLVRGVREVSIAAEFDLREARNLGANRDPCLVAANDSQVVFVLLSTPPEPAIPFVPARARFLTPNHPADEYVLSDSVLPATLPHTVVGVEIDVRPNYAQWWRTDVDEVAVRLNDGRITTASGGVIRLELGPDQTYNAVLSVPTERELATELLPLEFRTGRLPLPPLPVWVWLVTGTAGVVVFLIPLLVFRTPLVYRIRARFGARWRVEIESSSPALRMRILCTARAIQVTVEPAVPLAIGVYESSPRLPDALDQLAYTLPSHKSTDAEVAQYSAKLKEALGWDDKIDRWLANPNTPIELYASADLQKQYFECIDVGIGPVALTNPLTRQLVSDEIGHMPNFKASRDLRALIIGDPHDDEPYAANQARDLCDLFTRLGVSVHEPLLKSAATLEAVESVLNSKPGPWILHYVGHVDPADGGWEVRLHGRRPSAEEFVEQVASKGLVLAFMNACESLGAVGSNVPRAGLGAMFLRHGIPFIGTHVPVYAKPATDFALEFYRHFLPPRDRKVGATFGQAVLGARKSIGATSWFNYVAYGRVGFRLRFARLNPAEGGA